MADEGKLGHLAGVDNRYDVPEQPNITINAGEKEKGLERILGEI